MPLKRCVALMLSFTLLWRWAPGRPGGKPALQCPGCSRWNSASYQYCPYCGAGTPRLHAVPQLPLPDRRHRLCLLPRMRRGAPGCFRRGRPPATPQPYIYGHTIDRLATRSGPSTDFTGTGTYQVKDQDVPIFSVAYDVNGVAWVQCEVSYGGALRRVYTGLKRFDATTVDLSQVRAESQDTQARKAQLPGKATLRYGPGTEYGRLPRGCSQPARAGHVR